MPPPKKTPESIEESIEDQVSKPSHHAPPTSAHTCHLSPVISGESKTRPWNLWNQTGSIYRMGEGRLNTLLLLFMHKDVSIEVEKVVNVFVRRKPRRLLLADSMSDWTHRPGNLQINGICYMVWWVLIFPWAVLRWSKNVSSYNPNKRVPRKL